MPYMFLVACRLNVILTAIWAMIIPKIGGNVLSVLVPSWMLYGILVSLHLLIWLTEVSYDLLNLKLKLDMAVSYC
jgi:hypothetical protein